jgi:MFS family permease
MAGIGAEWRMGWRTVAAAGLGAATGLSLFSYVSSLFIKGYVAEFGWSRGEIAMTGIGTMIAGLSAPLIGRLADAIGIRTVIALSALGYAGACLGLASLTGDIRIYCLCMFLLVFCGLGATGLTWTRAISAAFERSRGLALSIALSMVSVTAVLLPPAMNAVMEANGWRAGWLLLGAVGLGATVLALFLLPAVHAARAPPRTTTTTGAASLAEAARHPAFWAVVGGMFLVNIPSGGLMNQMAALVSDKGFAGGDIALVLSAFAACVFVGRLVAGACLDRFPAHWVAFVTMAAPAIGCVILALPVVSLAGVVIGIGLAGLSQGAEGDVGPYVVARVFGLSAFGAINGCISAATVVGTAVGILLFGRTFDAFGGYHVALWIGAVSFLSGAVLFLGVAARGRPVAVRSAS